MTADPSQIVHPFFIGDEVLAKSYIVMVMDDDMSFKRNLKEGLNGVLKMGLIQEGVYC
jgi:hypothetical protein